MSAKGIVVICCSFFVASFAGPGFHSDVLETAIGGAGYDGGFTVSSPDPSVLVWDSTQSKEFPSFRAGWLNVPVLHDPYITPFEKPPHACLRVIMKPASKQPAKLGPILLHCGGPGSDASCAFVWGKWLEMNSSYLVGPPLSEDYDYWSISQRGMPQEFSLQRFGFNSKCPFVDETNRSIQSWPFVQCSGINDLKAKSGIKEVLARLDGNPDETTWPLIEEIMNGPGPRTFGVPFFNETYVRWLYRVMALEHNLCFHDNRYQLRSPTTKRNYNLLLHSSTADLARDIEIFRRAIGAKKMSVYGVSYGTKVGSVYATSFPDKVHRLILDGDMGSDPDVGNFASWVGESTEEVWTGIAEACDNSVMEGALPENRCPAGPGVNAKLHKLFKNAVTAEDKLNALVLFFALEGVIYEPDALCAPQLMKCIADLHATGNATSCRFLPGTCRLNVSPPLRYPGSRGAATIASVLGLDLAGRLTEESVVEWWRVTKDRQTLGITRSLPTTIAVGSWPVIPRPIPPAGNSVLAPLIIGNLHDGQTPYKNAQRMITAFPSGRLLTSQFYGHGLQGPRDAAAVVKKYEEEMRKGVPPTYNDEVAKLLCVKVALEYLKNGTLCTHDYVCKTAFPVQTGPGTTTTTTTNARMQKDMLVV